MRRLFFITAFFLLALPFFAESYSRIVCLSPSGAEIFFAIGAGEKIVARTEFCDYPSEIKKIESIGGFDGKTLSVEKIVATGCDFVYGSRTMHDFLKEPLKNFGITVHLENANSLESILKEILYCGQITDCETKAVEVVKSINKKIEAIKNTPTKQNASTNPIKIYFEIWNQPLTSAGKSSYINEIIEIAGGKNIFGELETDYPIVSAETILKSNPDLIILQSDSNETLETLKRRPAWRKINAIKNGNVKKVDSSMFSRPSPRIVEAVETLKSIVEETK